MSLIMSVYLSKVFMKHFWKVFDVRFVKVFYYIDVIWFLLVNIIITSKNDFYLIFFFSKILSLSKDVVSFLLKLFLLLFICYYIINTDLLIVRKSDNSNNEDNIENKNSINNKETKIKKFFYKISQFIFIYFDCFVNFFIICLIIKICQEYEAFLALRVIYGILIIAIYIIQIITIDKIEDNYSYHIAFFIWFIYSQRLIKISNTQLSFVLFVNYYNLLINIIFFFANEKRNYFTTALMTVILIFGHYKVYYYTIIIDIISLVFSFLFVKVINILNNSEDNEEEEELIEENEEEDEQINICKHNYNHHCVSNLVFMFIFPVLLVAFLQFKYKNLNWNKIKDIGKKLINNIINFFQDAKNRKNFERNNFFELNIIGDIVKGMKQLDNKYLYYFSKKDFKKINEVY